MLQKINFSETELIEDYLSNGNEHSLNQLLQRTQGKVFTSIYILVKDKYLAEDILQDTYIRAIQKMRAGLYLNDGKFSAWLSRIARNLCMDYFRSAKRHIKVTLSDGRDIFDFLPLEEETNIQDQLMLAQSGERLRLMLGQIPLEQREVIMMRLFSEMSFKEIADETNISINTALGRMRYGLLNLRKMMQERCLVL
jgi:RNA polymerase sigma factor (sigma-70 family)